MTTTSLMTTLRRRWYLVLVGLLATCSVCFYVQSRPGVYWTQVDVVFLAPQSQRYPNSLQQTTASVISMAGLVESYMNQGVTEAQTSSAGATLAGQGIRHGQQIRLPNSGGQWAVNFERPVLDVQVIGSDDVEVRKRLAAIVAEIEALLERLQADSGSRRRDFITMSAAPQGAQVFYLEGNATRALAVTALLGLAGTAIGTTAVDRRLALRKKQR